MTKVALTIAASDSSSGAGIQLDLYVFRDLGVYGVCAVTNVTAQNTQGVQKINKVPPRVVASQIDAVTRDFSISACKIGMLYSPQVVDTVAERISRREIPNVVLDPVIKAKNSEVLLTEPGIKRLKRNLIPKVMLITPNRDEASVLTGVEVEDISTAKHAAQALADMGARCVLIKGGHWAGEPIDLLYDGADFIEFRGKRLDKNMHGTGCALSSAITARLALGDDVHSAIAFAKNYVYRAIAGSVRLGKGNMDLFFQLPTELSD